MNKREAESKLYVRSVNLSKEKGTIKHPEKAITLGREGVSGDAHAGKWHRQVSLLGVESINKFSEEAKRKINFGEFAENITTEGVLLYQMNPLDILRNGEVELEITQIGKKCHGDNCSIFREVGNCVMPKEGIFARVKKGGNLKAGEVLSYFPKVYKTGIITLSDRAAAGEYKDISGRIIEQRMQQFFADNKMKTDIHREVIPDEPEILEKVFHEMTGKDYDLIFTCGGTGIGPRDITPDVLQPLFDKELPGIMEHIRIKYGSTLPAALLSRSVAGIKGTTQVYALPGSTKAVEEYIREITKIIRHATLMIHGLGH